MQGRRPATACHSGGFTLVELMAVLALISVLLTIGISSVRTGAQASRIKAAIADILQIQTAIDEFAMRRNRLPDSLVEVRAGDMRDPWGNAYVYFPFRGDYSAFARKDRFLVPINTLYDLYSAGADGRSNRPLTSPVSLDDIIRANDGAYVGLARAF